MAAFGRAWRDGTLLPYLALAVVPLLVIIFTPAVFASVPDCGDDEPWWELGSFQLALLPALADFLPFLWLASGSSAVRRAARTAGLIGAGRYVVLQGATLLAHASSGGQASNPDCTISVYFASALFTLMIVSWVVSAVVAAIFIFRTRDDQATA
jgi:hypothetical protein